MEVIDAQIHSPRPVRAWDAYDAETRNRFEVEVSLAAMDAVGVDAAIVHTDSWGFCEAAVKRSPERFGCVIQFMAPHEVSDPEAEIAALRTSPGMLGFRLIPGYPLEGTRDIGAALQEGKLEPFFSAAEKHAVPICMFVPENAGNLADIARAHPTLSLIVDHVGARVPPIDPLTPDLLDTLPDVLALAQFPNVAVKFTGVAALSMESYPFDDLWRRAGHRLIEAFTPQRLMWGSDYTRVQGLRTYRELVDFLLYTGEVSAADKEVMMGTAARQWFRWPRSD